MKNIKSKLKGEIVKHIHPPISSSDSTEELGGGLDDAACCASSFVGGRTIPDGYYLFCAPEDESIARLVWNATGDITMLEPLVGGSRIVHENPERL